DLPTGGASGFLHIGSSLYGSGSFDGMLDELTIYNDVLLPGQVFVGLEAGDMNGDTQIDLDDFNILLAHFGDQVGEHGSAATLAMGDMDVDGDVDFLDFDLFAAAYASANPGAAALSVPEPTSLALLGLGGLLLSCRRR
ncbi:MAG: PEP-CTERM sorting domain-containing protein, partial [Planctomycetota bacterium]